MQEHTPESQRLDLVITGMDEEWSEVKRRIPLGSLVTGSIVHHAHFGVFLQLPNMPFKGLIRIVDFKDEGRMTVEEFPAIGSKVAAVLLWFNDDNKQLDLGAKPSQLTAVHQKLL